MGLHYDGLTQVEAGSDPCTRNVIFVHGATGHYQYTWGLRSSDGLQAPATRDGVPGAAARYATVVDTGFWPKSLLPHDLPGAKIWAFGYTTSLPKDKPIKAKNINSRAKDLIEAIEKKISNQSPIVFVAHGFGGVIVKAAMTILHTLPFRARNFIFLGTPRFWNGRKGWQASEYRLARQVWLKEDVQLVKPLKDANEIMQHIDTTFLRMARGFNFEVHSFVEGQPPVRLPELSRKVVEDKDAILGLGEPIEYVHRTATTHRQMTICKDKDDPRYQAILKILRGSYRFNESAARAAAQRNDMDEDD